MALHAKLGIAPIAWSNDDLPQLGGDTPLTTCLAEARLAGFSGIKTDGKFPKTGAEVTALLQHHHLKQVFGWYSGTLLDSPLEAEKDKVQAQLSLFRQCGAACLVYGETAGTIQNRQDISLANRRTLTDEQIKAYAQKLTHFAEFCAERGVPLAFHHHMGTVVESEQDIDRLMAYTGSAVGLLCDTGHLAFAGADLIGVLKRHGKRIIHVHAKDIRRDVLIALDRKKSRFLRRSLKGFTRSQEME